jgi:hypothetical protein
VNRARTILRVSSVRLRCNRIPTGAPETGPNRPVSFFAVRFWVALRFVAANWLVFSAGFLAAESDSDPHNPFQ